MTELEPVIREAETARAAGNLNRAIRIAHARGDIDPGAIPFLSPAGLRDAMRLWRIWTVSLLSTSQRTWSGNTSMNVLEDTKQVIDRLYHHPAARAEAARMHADPAGNEYEMAAEMIRDEGKLHFYLYTLTLNPEELNLAIRSFDRAVTLAPDFTSAHSVAVMEREIASKKAGKPVDLLLFRAAYDRAVMQAKRAKNWDRMATISWWYARESAFVKPFPESLRGLYTMVTASLRMKRNPMVFPSKDVVGFVSGVVRRVTLSR